METIVLTASSGTFPDLSRVLTDVPVLVQERPLLSFLAPLDWTPFDKALNQKSRYGAVALTSPRTAHALVERLDARRLIWDEATGPAIWAVGHATIHALQGRAGPIRRVEAQSGVEESAALSLARAMLNAQVSGPVLFPCGELHRPELPRLLRSEGVSVDEVVCYRTVLASREQARAALGRCAVVVAASPSVVELLALACPESARPRLVAVGPTTAAAARAAGWPPAAVATEPSTQALAFAISGLLAARLR
jgi:uroporphyrinogen-III synthase